jgi:hypothetical protein
MPIERFCLCCFRGPAAFVEATFFCFPAALACFAETTTLGGASSRNGKNRTPGEMSIEKRVSRNQGEAIILHVLMICKSLI